MVREFSFGVFTSSSSQCLSALKHQFEEHEAMKFDPVSDSLSLSLSVPRPAVTL